MYFDTTYFRPLPNFDHLSKTLPHKNLNKLNFAVVMAPLFTAGTDMLGTYFFSDLAVESEAWINNIV